MQRSVLFHGVAASMLLFVSGCATKGFVREEVRAVESRVTSLESGLAGAEGDVNRVLAAMDNLQLEHKLVVGMREGANFNFDSAQLTPQIRSEIDRFLAELEERQGAGANGAREVFVVAGHTDASGPDDYNFELAHDRAQKIAGYLVGKKGVDPLGLAVVSYGESAPLADNTTPDGRRQNRRVEILVYGEKVSPRI